MKAAPRFFSVFFVSTLVGLLLYVPARIAVPWLAQSSCDTAGYRQHAFLSNCLNEYFGDYEHGAYYYQLEPEAIEALRKAEVLFLGNSRSQFAFSSDVTAEFFAKQGIPYYLLGFAYVQTSEFPLRLIKRLALHPKLLVINADPFFSHIFKGPAQQVVDGSASARFDYTLKRWFQSIHPALCRSLPRLCQPKQATIYRDMRDGRWLWLSTFSDDKSLPISEPIAIPQRLIDDAISVGRDFINQIGIDKACVVLTGIPTRVSSAEAATQIAQALGVKYIEPSLSGLATIDGEHLNVESANRWSRAFLPQLQDTIRHCLFPLAAPDRAQ